jgi:hypothetical protein
MCNLSTFCMQEQVAVGNCTRLACNVLTKLMRVPFMTLCDDQLGWLIPDLVLYSDQSSQTVVTDGFT